MRSPADARARRVAWLDAPLRPLQGVLGWLVASVAYVGLVQLLGGPIEGDAAESVYSTWAIAHGDLACAYPPTAHLAAVPTLARPFVFVAPLYPLLSGAVAALTRIGSRLPFPRAAALGPNCRHAVTAMYAWSTQSSAIIHTIDVAYATWPVLLAGAVYLLRSTPVGRTRWEPLALVGLAVVPPVFMPVVDSFHPQDVLAVGLALAGVGCALRGRWVLAGVWLGLALTSQQFALLVLLPLIAMAPSARRWMIAGAAALAAAAVDAPVLVATHGRALGVELLGSSRIGLFGSPVASHGGTVLFALGLHGILLFVVCRGLPLLGAVGLALWLRRRDGDGALDAGALLAVLAVGVSLRLVFEENLFSYYFLAVTVLLVLGDVVRRRPRASVLAWVALVAVAYNPIPWGYYSNWTIFGNHVHGDLSTVTLVVGMAAGAWSLARTRRAPWYLAPWALAIVLVGYPALWGRPAGLPVAPGWVLQLLLVPPVIALAWLPLRADARRSSGLAHVDRSAARP